MKRPAFLKNIRGLILDMDGVIWRGPQPIGDLPRIFDRIDSAGYKVVLATNNASRSAHQHLDHIASFGVSNLAESQVINSLQAATALLVDRFPRRGPVYLIGEPALAEVITAAGFTIDSEHGLAVVVGIDRSFTYAKLAAAQRLILNGALFIATNTDRTFPIPGGLTPGTGALIAAIQAATEVEPIVAGKPSPALYEMALQRMGLQPDEALVVGDRLETDIVGAQALGCRTALVLSGVSTAQQAADWSPALDLILPDLTAVLNVLID